MYLRGYVINSGIVVPTLVIVTTHFMIVLVSKPKNMKIQKKTHSDMLISL